MTTGSRWPIVPPIAMFSSYAFVVALLVIAGSQTWRASARKSQWPCTGSVTPTPQKYSPSVWFDMNGEAVATVTPPPPPVTWGSSQP
jgi:hypothetical protein